MTGTGTLPVVATLSIGLLLGIQLVGTTQSPYVAWSFDKYNGTKLIPDFNDEIRFQSDFSELGSDPSEVFVAGVVGEAVQLKKSQTFDIVSDISGADCVRDPEVCQHGLTIAFWLKLESWNGNDFQVIFTTTSWTKTLPGIHFGKGEDEHLHFWLRLSSGPTFEAQFSHDVAWQQWAHIGITWNKSDGALSVYINGSALSIDVTRGRAQPIYPIRAEFSIGSSMGPAFLLDEFQLFYSVLSEDEIYAIYNPHRPSTVFETSPATSCTGSSKRPLTAYFTSLAGHTMAPDYETTTEVSTTAIEATPSPAYVYAIAIIVPVVLILLAIALLIFCCCSRRRVVDDKSSNPRQKPAQFVRMFSIQGYKRTTVLEPEEVAFAAVPSEDSDGDFEAARRHGSVQES